MSDLDTTVIDPVIDDVISEVDVSEITRTVGVGEDSAEELLMIADSVAKLGDQTVALEAYRQYAQSVMRRLDLGVQVSFEGLGNEDLAKQCTTIALGVSESLEGYESYARFLFPFRSNFGKLKDVEKRLNIAKKKLTLKIKRLEDETTKIRHNGMYWFLIRDGRNVDNPAPELKESLDGLVDIYKLVTERFEEIFKSAIDGIKKCGDDNDVAAFHETIENLDSPVVELYSHMKTIGSLALMGSRQLVFEEKTNNTTMKVLTKGKLDKSWAMGGGLKLVKDEEPPVAGTYQIVDENDIVLFDLEASANNALHRAVKSFIPKSHVSAAILNQMVDIGTKAVSDARHCFEVSDKAEKTVAEWKAEYNKAMDSEAFSKDSKALLKKVNRMCDVTSSTMDSVMSISIKQMIYMLGGTAALIDVSTDNVR